MELLVSAKLAHPKFHGIPWNCSCQRNWRISSSTEFHGTAHFSEIGAFQVPWNSMELAVCQFRWHEPWNFSSQQNWRTSSSMEFHGTARVIEIGALEVPWNSWNCLCQRNWRTWSSMEFLGIPWNCSCQRNWRILSSMEFHGIPWNCSCQRNWHTPSSMEFHGIPWNAGWINFHKLINTLYLFISKSLSPTYVLLSIFALYLICISGITHYVTKYHSKSLFNAHWNLFGQKVPWNFLQSSMELFEQHLNNTCGSMEFHGILSRSKVPWNSMELFPYSQVPWNSMELLIFPKKVPWNSMELFLKFHHGIPWNLINFIFKKNHISKYCFWYLIDD